MLNSCLFIKIAIVLEVMGSGKQSCAAGRGAGKFLAVSTVHLPSDQPLDLLGGDGDISVAKQGLDSLPLKNWTSAGCSCTATPAASCLGCLQPLHLGRITHTSTLCHLKELLGRHGGIQQPAAGSVNARG